MSFMNPQQQHVADRIAQLRTFLETHGHLPQRRSTDREERHLADWAYRHLRTMKPWPEAVELIEGAGGYRQNGHAPATQARKQQLKEFLDTHHRLPKPSCDEQVESDLGRWAYSHITKSVRADSEVLLWVKSYGGFPSRPWASGKRKDRSQELRKFIDAHGRMPVNYSDPYEAGLYSWVNSNRRAGTLPRAARVLVDRFGGVQHTTQRRISELENFVATHNRMPARKGSTAEKSLHGWLLDYRKNEYVDPRVTGIIEFYSRRGQHQKSLALVAELHEFIAAHGRFPLYRDDVEGERKLYHRVYADTRKEHPHPAILVMARQHGMNWEALDLVPAAENHRAVLRRQPPLPTQLPAAG